jgi:transcriptional regulator with XRE-family HTH domain
MVYIDESARALVALGGRLRAARLARNEAMGTFAERIGVSVPTLREMERGAATVQIGSWLNALWALGRLEELSALLVETESLIERAKRARSPTRRRASKVQRPA